MEALLGAIVTSGNIAVVVLMVVYLLELNYRRDTAKTDREARKEDSYAVIKAIDRQTESTNQLAAVITELRVQTRVQQSTGGRS